MKDKSIKLTENQLAEMFQNNSQKHTSKSDANDCYTAAAASSARLNHVEDLINDRSSAQAMQVAMSLKGWSQVMAEAVDHSRRSWFSFLGMETPFKTSVATVAFAFAMVIAIPEISQYNTQEQIYTPVMQGYAQDDVINAMQFDENNDQLSSGGFDSINGESQNDGLFNGSFG